MASDAWKKAAREGRYAAALEALEAARAAVANRDAAAEGLALAGLASVHISVGQHEAARGFAQQALKIAVRDDLRTQMSTSYVALARIEAAMEQWAEADLYATKALQLLADAPPGGPRAEAALAAAEVALGTRRPAEAMDLLRRVSEEAGPEAEALRPAALLWQGIVLSEGTRPLQALATLERAFHAAEETSDLESLWQIHLALGRLHQAVGDLGRGEQHLRLSAGLVERIAALLPAPYKSAYLSTSPRKELLAELGVVQAPRSAEGGSAPSPDARATQGLGRIAELIKKINSEVEIGALLRTIVDTMVDLTKARAGYLLLLDKTRIALEVARGRDRRELGPKEVKFSRTVAERVARTGRPVITGNAPQDPQIGEADSIRELSLRSILCLPLRIKARTIGVIYLDNAEQLEAFSPGDQELVGILADQAAIAIDNATLHERSVRDALTGTHNHAHFEMRLEEEVKRAQRHGRICSLLLLDIDDFKLVNDALGHEAGSAVLRETAEVLREVTRSTDVTARPGEAVPGPLVGRYGGDEFEVLLAETGRDGMRAVADRILEQVRGRRFQASDREVDLRVSIGGATYPDDAADARSLFLKADEALYQAKKAGKDRFWTWEASAEGGTAEPEVDPLLLTKEGRLLLTLVSRVLDADAEGAPVLGVSLQALLKLTSAERGFLVSLDDPPRIEAAHGMETPDFAAEGWAERWPSLAEAGKSGQAALWAAEGRSSLAVPIGDAFAVLESNATKRQFGEAERNLAQIFARKVQAPARAAVVRARREASLRRIAGWVTTAMQELRSKGEDGADAKMLRFLESLEREARKGTE